MIPTIHAAAEQLRHGRPSPVALLESCLAQIDRLEAQLRGGGLSAGVPSAFKAFMDAFDWPPAGGWRLWQAGAAGQDATVGRNRRQAGAVLTGKPATPPYAGFAPAPPRNPWA